jgi:Peptidase propeptide and YPEB domain
MTNKTLLANLGSSLAIGAALLAGAAALPAFATSSGSSSNSSSQSSSANSSQGLSDAQIQDKLGAAGYRNIDRIERRSDRVKVKATDAQGRRVELKIDPVSADVLRSEFRHDSRSDDRRGSSSSTSGSSSR